MKKYICPLTEKQEVMHMSCLCDESAGWGMHSAPTNPGGDTEPLGAPIRLF